MDSVVGPLSKTILGFSRPTAATSEKLKEQLALRGRRSDGFEARIVSLIRHEPVLDHP